MNSLRRAILFWMALLLFIVGTVSAAVTYEYVKDETQSSFDAEIRQVAEFLQNETAGSLPKREALAVPNPDNRFLIQVWNLKGELIRTSDKTVSAQMPQSSGFSIQNLGFADWRSYSIVGAEQITRVSLPLDERNEQASNAALQVAIPVAVTIPLSWLGLSLLIDRLLRSLDAAATQVKSRKTGDTTQISMRGVPREIAPFVEGINSHVAQVQAQAEKQKRFLADAAHELRTPLTALSIQLDNLKTVLRTKDQRQRLAAAEGGSRRANQLVSRLLQLARHDSFETKSDQNLGVISKLIEQVIGGFQAQIKRENISIVADISSTLKLSVPALEFSQLFEIVLENAVQHAPRGSVIEVKAAPEMDYFIVEVSDQGPGISPEKLPFVFDRFYSAEPKGTQGTGLGLAIAKAICDRRNWRIRLENRKLRSGIKAKISGKVSTS
ncbi:MAG: HAMP domain-containing histidine kinase [Pseudomonadota bacterium]|nr:HAMP domain-containing histidine kinase [Pseudomonadota bacterium]